MMKTITVTNYFGGCPTCGGNDGCVDADGRLVSYCKEHKVSWEIGGDEDLVAEVVGIGLA
jgi:hypothetical protein